MFFMLMKTPHTHTQAHKFANAMKSPLIFCSSANSTNVQNIFKIVLSKAFNLKCNVPEVDTVGEAVIIYKK